MSRYPPPSPAALARKDFYGMATPTASHRNSLSDQLRGAPQSPRNHRGLSISSTNATDLLNFPPVNKEPDSRFIGRDWHSIELGELASASDVNFVELNTRFEDATNLLIGTEAACIFLRTSKEHKAAIATFDFKDLNQYLLFATGNLRPTEEQRESVNQIIAKTSRGEDILVEDAKALGSKEPFVTLSSDTRLTKVVEVFGGGVHRVLVTKNGSDEVIGVLSQFRLIKFFWENQACFEIVQTLSVLQIKDLELGAYQPISINGDRPLREALLIMHNESISSIAVVDNNRNVVGNISTVDTKHLTRSSSIELLSNTCIHFISVILSTRGMLDGKDSYPVFHITPYSTLAHTMSKLVATKSHRLWVVDSASPLGSAPPTPSLAPPSVNIVAPNSQPQAFPPFQHPPASPSISAASMPGSHLSGRLCGVASLTDILNLFSRASGQNPNDPGEHRRSRRRSSSSSLVRDSMESTRSESAKR